MGRWTHEYEDDTLSYKFKRLVTGAIKRAKIEKSESTTISYKHFVQDLDVGDSFTTTILSILVEELSERRKRMSVDSTATERGYITQSTAQRLRQLALSSRYHERSRPASRPFGTSFLSAPPDVMDMEDDDEDALETVLQHGSAVPEGVQINTELYEALPSWAPTGATRRIVPISGSPPTPTLFHPASPTATSPPPAVPSSPPIWTTLPTTTLSRQPSLRRHGVGHSRTTDFHAFAAQRRTSARDDRGASEEPWSANRATRRFFPFSSQSRRHGSHWGDGGGGEGSRNDDDAPHDENYPTPYSSFPEPTTSSSSSSQEDTYDPLEAPSRRLRRGGIRPPESMLFQRPSPARDEGLSDRSISEPRDFSSLVADFVSYPTPGSPSTG